MPAVNPANLALAELLQTWVRHFEAHDVAAVVELFTPAALFRGLSPQESIGRESIRAYYAAVTPGVRAQAEIGHAAQIAPGAIVGFVAMAFELPDGANRPAHLAVTATECADGRWRFAQWHMGPAEGPGAVTGRA